MQRRAHARTALPNARQHHTSHVGTWIGIAVVMAYQHTWQPPIDQRGGAFGLVYLWWVIVAVWVVVAATAIRLNDAAGRTDDSLERDQLVVNQISGRSV